MLTSPKVVSYIMVKIGMNDVNVESRGKSDPEMERRLSDRSEFCATSNPCLLVSCNRLLIKEAELEKKAEYAEIMKNFVCPNTQASREKRAMMQARRREDILSIEEKAAKCRATGYSTNGMFGYWNGIR
ncbi:hypothetical protein Ancab_037823 [Ancistrocladus abbreviatus]